MCFAPQRRALFRHLNLQKWRQHVVVCTFWLQNVLGATTACTFSTSQRPRMVCFVHFDFEMCFAPQRRALFRHLNFQKWSEHGVFCTFRLQNVLRATTACTFSTSQLPKVVRACGVLYILTSKCASRHHGVHFFDISTSKSGPSMVCFVHFDFKMCFAPQRRALFQHLNFQKWSEHGVFVHFDLEMCFAPQQVLHVRYMISICLSIYPSSIYLPIYLSIYIYYVCRYLVIIQII